MRPIALACFAFAAGCHRGPSAAPVPHNHAPAGTALHVSADEPLGWLAIATTPVPGGTWLPSSDHIGAFTLTDDPLPAHVTALDARGASADFTLGASVPLQYGCDNNQLGVHPLVGPHLAPGPVWILPPSAPAAWRPAGVEVSRTRGDPALRSYVAGSLAFTLARKDASRATLTITHDGKPVYETTYQRAEMEGADTSSPIDLAETVPGMPELLAAWSFSPAGPFLAVLLVPGYEGVTLVPMLVDANATHVVEGMDIYLYACAF